MKAPMRNDQILMLVFLAILSFIVGVSVGANSAAEDANKDLSVQDAEVIVTTPTTSEPVTYEDVVCDFEDEVAVVITEDWDENNQIGDRYCVSFDDLVPRTLP